MGIMQIVSIIQTKAVGYDEYFLSIKQVYGYMSYDEKVPIHTNAHEVYLLPLVYPHSFLNFCVYIISWKCMDLSVTNSYIVTPFLECEIETNI